MDNIEKQMRDAIATEFNRYVFERVRCPSLKKMAAFIEEHLGYDVEIEQSHTNTDTHYKNSRLRHPGKGRTGNKLSVYAQGHKWGDEPIYEHDSSETYRRNTDVARWIVSNIAKAKAEVGQ